MSARCRAVRGRLPSVDDLQSLEGPLRRHAETCLRCQAEAARYRSMRRRLAALAFVVEPAPARLSDTVAAAGGIPVVEGAPRSGAARTAVAAAAGAAIVAGAAVLLGRRLIRVA